MTGAYRTHPLLLARDRNTKEISLLSLLLLKQLYQVANDSISSVKTRKMTTQYLVRAALKTHTEFEILRHYFRRCFIDYRNQLTRELVFSLVILAQFYAS